MKQRLLFFFFLLLLVSGSGLYAQQQRDSLPGGKFRDIFSVLLSLKKPVPEWVYHVDWSKINVNEVESAYKKYAKWENHGDSKNSLHKYADYDTEEDEDPWFVVWHELVDPLSAFVDDLGYFNYSDTAAARYYNQVYRAYQGATARNTTTPTTGFAIANWQVIPNGLATNPNNGGDAQSSFTSFSGVAVCRTKPNVVYVNGTEFYRSSDRGQTWRAMDGNVPGGAHWGYIAVHPVRDSVVFQLGIPGDLYKSTDAGQSWQQLTNLPAAIPASKGKRRSAIRFSPFGSRLFVARYDHVFFSDNLGTSWAQPIINYPDTNVLIYTDVIYHATDSSILYLVGHKNNAVTGKNDPYFFKSTDFGHTFNVIDSITGTNNTYGSAFFRFAVTKANPNILWASALWSGGIRMFKSSNNGRGWKDCNAPAGSYVDYMGIAASQIDSNKVIFGSTDGTTTINGGLTWFRPANFAVHADQSPYGQDSLDRIYIASHGGISYSDDFFQTAVICHSGLTGTHVWGFAHSWLENFFVSTTNHNGFCAYYRPNYGSTKFMRLGGYETSNSATFTGPGMGLMYGGNGSYSGRAWLAPSILGGQVTNAGIGRSIFEAWPFSDNNRDYRMINSPRYSKYIYQSNVDSLFWISTDNGNSCIPIYKFPTRNIGRFVISRTNPKIMYIRVNGFLYKSLDGGYSWANTGMPCSFDMAVHPQNSNIVWTTSGTTVFKSINGGGSWQNLGSTGYGTTYVVSQGGRLDALYVFCQGTPSRVFYIDNSMTSWVPFHQNLSQAVDEIVNPSLWFGGDTLRMGTSVGIWQSPVYAPTDYVQAMPTTKTDTLSCSRDTAYFSDLSIVRYGGAQFRWSFPGAIYVSDSTSREPKVVYGSAGAKSVKLFVQDATGQKDSITVPDMVYIKQTCRPDTIPNLSLQCNGGANGASSSVTNLGVTNTFTLSAWLKFDSVKANGGIIYTPGILYSTNMTGLRIHTNNRMGYIWNGAYWDWAGGPVLSTGKWYHVALVVTPAQAIIYVNGVPYKNNVTHSPIELNGIWHLGGRDGNGYKGKMDEIALYNRALSQKEIREQMHLTKNYDSTDAGLKAYYQFNESNGEIIDRAGSAHASLLGSASRVPSTAPVGNGRSQTIAVTSGGLKEFNNADVELTFPGSGTYPNGDVVATRLNLPPDQLATTPTLPTQPKTHYWIIHNYGTNSSFSSLTGIKFKQVLGTTPFAVSTPALIKLYKRGSTDDGTSWGSPLDAADNVTDSSGIGTVSFTTGLSNTGFSQYMMGTLGVPLPVRLLRFTGVKEGEEAALLRWEVADELDLWGYELERSTDGVNYITIGQVPAAGADSYSYRDNGPVEGYNYYRLKMKDTGGRSSYSNVVILLFGSKEQRFSLSPVPAGDNVMLRMSRPLAEDMTADLYTAGGHLLSRYSIPRGSSNRQIDLAKYASGMYIISVKNAKGDIQFKQMFSKQ